jgi:hypothetical protein
MLLRRYTGIAINASELRTALGRLGQQAAEGDQVSPNWPADRLLPSIGKVEPVKALEQALRAIAARYGARTADFVAMQLEYPRRYARP